MTFFQYILIALVLGLLFVYARYFKLLYQRLFFILLFCTGIYLIIFHEITNDLATFLGITRGADLIFYTFVLFSFFIYIYLFQRIRILENNVVRLVREDAIKNAGKPDQTNS